MARRNRVDPWGDLHAVDARGLFTGNRGCLVDDDRQLARHHASNLWITCVTDLAGRRYPLDAPHHWTPLFFLDDAVALAAGHRPCGYCRRDEYLAYKDAVAAGPDGLERPSALALNRRLATERLRRGRGIDRRGDRRTWVRPIGGLPDGTVVVLDGAAQLVAGDRLYSFSFDGWADPVPRPPAGDVDVLTPPTSVLALGGGFRPVLHPSAGLS